VTTTTRRWTTLAVAAALTLANPEDLAGMTRQANPEVTPSGNVVYWCPTDEGCSWTRIELRGMQVLSLRRFDMVAIEEEPRTGRFVPPPLPASPATATTTEPAPAPIGDDARDLPVYAARGADCYHHRDDCLSGAQILAVNRLSFVSPAAARQAGLQPCRFCGQLDERAARGRAVP